MELKINLGRVQFKLLLKNFVLGWFIENEKIFGPIEKETYDHAERTWSQRSCPKFYCQIVSL